MLRKIVNVIGLAADLAPGVLLVAIGLGVAVGGATGALWL